MRDGYLRGALSPKATQRQIEALAAFVAAGGSVSDAAELVGIRPSTVKRHLADLRARSGLSTEQLIYRGRAEGWLVVRSDRFVKDVQGRWGLRQVTGDKLVTSR
jgi:predicted ArsR family transcriptional regulator